MNAPGPSRVYGLNVSGLAATDLLLPGRDRRYASVHVLRGETPDDRPPFGEPWVSPDRAVVSLREGRFLELDRASGQLVFSGPVAADDDLVHPYFGPAAAIVNRWLGRETFHAGGVVLGDAAWAVLGPREAGKSTLLAGLADHGLPVLSDDLFVTDGEVAFAGPRCIDLRRPIPGQASALRYVRADTRHRLLLPPTSAEVPLGGWLFLRWSEDDGRTPWLEPLSPPRLLALLAAGRSWRTLASDPTLLLNLAAQPGWVLHRPRTWSAFDFVVGLLLDGIPQQLVTS